MENNYFHKRIKDTIEEMSYNFYLIKPIEDIICPCVEPATQQANPDCHMCLGVGRKIKIKKIRGASNEVESNVAGKGVKGAAAMAVGRTYFINKKYPIGNKDMIIDDGEVLYVYRVYKMKAFNGEHTHDQVSAVPRRNDHHKIVTNFNKIMKQHKRNENKIRNRRDDL